MRRTIFLAITFFLIFNPAYAQYPHPPELQPIINFFFRIYQNNTVELIKLEQTIGYPFSNDIGDYKVRIISEDGRVLNETIVDIFFLYDKVKKEGVVVSYRVREFVDVYLSLPYHPEASRIELYHFDKLIYQKEVPTERVEHCGNGICDAWESYETCPRDCSLPAEIITTTTTTIKPETTQKRESIPYSLIIIALALILTLLLFLIYKTSRKSETYVE